MKSLAFNPSPITTLHAVVIATAMIFGLPSGPARAQSLTIGSPAPVLDIAHWFHDQEPVTSFEKGKVYVVEFWATWCGPCISSMPHLAEIQKKHPDDLVVISVSTEERETIEQFLDRERDGTTYREITSSYRLATDPDRSVSNDYMRAAGQNGIPCAFLVGKTGEIEWIGHPMRMDEPVAQVIAGTWDRKAHARRMAEEREVREQLQLVFEKVRENQREEALSLLDRLIAQAPSPEARETLKAAQRRVRMDSATVVEGSRPHDTTRVTSVEIQKLEIGDQVTIRLTGRTNGSVWGDSIYTLDSDIATAAVHAGVVKDGETKAIKVWVVPAPKSFSDAKRNGVQSRRWGAFRAAFVMQAASPTSHRVVTVTPPRTPVTTSVNVSALAIGEAKTVTLTGQERGPLWGTDTYTSDSSVAAAAVHCGALRVGETGDVVVTRVTPPSTFQGSLNNGVRSSSWGAYPAAFTVKPAAGEKR